MLKEMVLTDGVVPQLIFFQLCNWIWREVGSVMQITVKQFTGCRPITWAASKLAPLSAFPSQSISGTNEPSSQPHTDPGIKATPLPFNYAVQQISDKHGRKNCQSYTIPFQDKPQLTLNNL